MVAMGALPMLDIVKGSEAEFWARVCRSEGRQLRGLDRQLRIA
jgi:hypothetical protein